jgi:hypothetical protein
MAKKRKPTRRHRLLVYYRLGQRWRTAPFLTALLGAVLYGLGWLASRSILQGGNLALLHMLWEKRSLLLGLIGFSLVLYLLTIVISRGSYVEARPKALRVRAGLVNTDISYTRIRQMRLVQVTTLYPPESLKGADSRLLGPLLGYSCSAIDLKSWPKQPLRKLWHKFMFASDRDSILFIVEDAMILNQQIDGAIAARHARVSKTQRGYKDPIERAIEQANKARR